MGLPGEPERLDERSEGELDVDEGGDKEAVDPSPTAEGDTEGMDDEVDEVDSLSDETESLSSESWRNLMPDTLARNALAYAPAGKRAALGFGLGGRCEGGSGNVARLEKRSVSAESPSSSS